MVGVPSVAAHMRGIAKVAQRLGLVVKSVAGWETRGRDASLDPHAITCHHTAAPHDSDSILIKGRADLAGPLCNWALHADGTVVAVASGGGGMPSR